MLPFFPLASGMLTGKYQRGHKPPEGTRLAAFGDRGKAAMSDENFDKVEKLSEFASARDHTLLELGMSWLACQLSVSSVIAGATSVDQVRQNAAAASWQLGANDLDQLAAL